MRSIYRYIPPTALIIGSMISIWFLICNLQPLQPPPYTFAFSLVIGIYLAIKVFGSSLITKVKRYTINITKSKYFVTSAVLVITAVGLLARLYFYFKFTYVPTSDPMTFYNSANTLASRGNDLGNSYVAFQPYLSAYNNALSEAMKIISNPWLATILLNTFFDILSAFAIYILLKKILKPGSRLPIVAFGAWMLSPLNLIFSVISLPIIIVNFFVILTILASYLLMEQASNLKVKNALLLSTVLGLIVGFGNCFRPIFIVPIIALAIIFIFMFLTANKSTRFFALFTGCLLVSLILFMSIQKLNLAFVSNQTGLHAAKNPSGWSMYVGSTWESYGEWRPYHNDNLKIICADSLAKNNFDECHAKLRSTAIAQYKKYGILKSTDLFIRKLYHQAEEQNYFYNAENSIVGYASSRTFKLINTYSVIYLLILFILSAKFLYNAAKYSATNHIINPVLIFITLLMVGWFVAFMFVESAPRYATILYPAFIIFSVLALDNKYTYKNQTK